MHTGSSCYSSPGPTNCLVFVMRQSAWSMNLFPLSVSLPSLQIPLEGSLPLRWACLTPAFTYFERFRLTCKLEGPQARTLVRTAYTQLSQKVVFGSQLGLQMRHQGTMWMYSGWVLWVWEHVMKFRWNFLDLYYSFWRGDKMAATTGHTFGSGFCLNCFMDGGMCSYEYFSSFKHCGREWCFMFLTERTD